MWLWSDDGRVTDSITSHMWQENEITLKKIVFAIFGTSYLGRGTCGLHGMDIHQNIFQNKKVAVSQLCFEIEKF